MPRLISSLTTVALALLVVQSVPSAQCEDRLRLGVLSGLTGAAAKWSRFQNMGMELAVEEAAAEGVVIELVFEDSQTQGARAISAYNKLVALSKVDALLADDFGLATAPIIPLARRQRKMLMSTGLPRQEFCDAGGGYFASVGSKIEDTKPAFERFFDLHPEVKRIGLVVFDDPDWGNAYREVWQELAKRRGIEIVETFLNNEWTPDFKSLMAKMITKKPDAILVAHEPESFLKAVRQSNFRGQVLIANCVLEMVADSEAPRAELDGVYTVDPVISSEFREAFRKRFNRAPILEAYAGYEAVRSVVKAAAVNRQGLSRGLRAVSYTGVAGRIDFTGTSCLGNNASWGLYQFNQGNLAGPK